MSTLMKLKWFLDTFFWRDCIFKDYCLIFFTSSVEKKKTHVCSLKHKVPTILSKACGVNGRVQEREVVRAIEIILESTITNPPKELLNKITEFSVKARQTTTVIRLGKTLKTIVNEDIRISAWNTFIESLLQATFSVHTLRSLRQLSASVNNILSSILSEDDRQLCFKALSTAAKFSERNNKIQLLSCFEFVCSFEREVTGFYPLDFRLATLKQFLSEPKPETRRSFGYKICKTFSFNTRSVEEMYKLQPTTVQLFLDWMIKSDTYALPNLKEMSNHVRRLGLADEHKRNHNHISDVEEKNRASLRSSFDNTNTHLQIPTRKRTSLNSSNEEDILPKTDPFRNFQSTSKPKLVTKHEKVLEKLSSCRPNLSYLKTLFDDYQNQKEGLNDFLKLLDACDDSQKECLNPITWTFFQLNVLERNWSTCISLYEGFRDINCKTVKSFLDDKYRNSPHSYVFAMINGCLESNYCKEALQVFVGFKFHKSITIWNDDENITEEFSTEYQALCSLMSEQTENLVRDCKHSTKEIKCLLLHTYRGQGSLKEPLDLIYSVGGLLDILIGEKNFDEATRIIIELIDNKHFVNMKMALDSFRIIINNLVKVDKGNYAVGVMKRALKYVHIYPKDIKQVECTTLTVASCLSQNEMLCLIQTAFYYSGTHKCRKFVFEEHENSELINQCVGRFSIEISAAMTRFQETLRRYYPNSGIMKCDDYLMIDPVVMASHKGVPKVDTLEN